MNANDKIDEAVGKIRDRFGDIFSSHTVDHNKVVSTKIDRDSPEGDFRVDFECFNDFSPYQLDILKMLFAANGYLVTASRYERWLARLVLVDVGINQKPVSPSRDILNI